MGIEIIVELASSDQENYFQSHHVGCNFQPQMVLPNFLTGFTVTTCNYLTLLRSHFGHVAM